MLHKVFGRLQTPSAWLSRIERSLQIYLVTSLMRFHCHSFFIMVDNDGFASHVTRSRFPSSATYAGYVPGNLASCLSISSNAHLNDR